MSLACFFVASGIWQFRGLSIFTPHPSDLFHNSISTSLLLMTKPLPPHNDESRFSFRSLLAAGIIVATFFFIGLALSAVLYSVTPKVFQSSAIVLIESRDPPTASSATNFRYRHDQLICEDNIVTKALKAGLDQLPTLNELPMNIQINSIQSNFEVQSENSDGLYRLCFRSPDARDAETILATLIDTYDKHLTEKYRDFGQDTRELLLKLKEKFADDLAAQIKNIEQVESQIAAGQIREDSQPTLKELRKKVKLSQDKLGIAESQLEEQASSPRTNLHKGFKFTVLSPPSTGALIWPLLPVFLLVGGAVGMLIGLILAGLVITVLSNRN